MGQVVAIGIPEAEEILPPHPIKEEHDLAQFDCGEDTLNEWLRKRAITNQAVGASRTYVTTRGGVVLGYYCLSAGSVAHTDAIRDLKRNMPNPAPVMVMGRLAVCKSVQGQGFGPGMLKDAILRTVQVSEIAGITALLVHALNEDAAKFYAKQGFRSSRVTPLTMMLPMKEILANYTAA